MPTDDSQLVFIVDSNTSDPVIDYVNSADTTPSTFVTGGPFGTNPSLTNPYQLVADTAAGIYFVIDPNFTLIDTVGGIVPAGGTVREGRIGSPASPTTVAYTLPSPGVGEVSALAIDTVNHVVYVAEDALASVQNFGAHSGIVKFSYDPVTGAVSGATDVFVRPSGANNHILSLSLDSANQKLYFVDDSEGQFGSAPSITNEVEVLNLKTNTATVLATLPSGSHFFGSTNDYTKGAIVAVAEDTADHLTFFSTGTDFNTPAAQALNRIYVVDDHTANQTPVQLTELAGLADRMDPKFMSFDPVHRQLWVSYIGFISNSSTTQFGFVTRYDVTGTTPGTVALTNPVIFLPPSPQSPFPQGSFLDVLPTLSVSASNAAAIEQGTAAVLLAAPPGIVDADNDHLAGATVKIAGGTFVSNESSKADDHLGFAAANVTGSFVNGTNITFSYDSGSETLILTGYDTLAHYATALSKVQYNATGDNPTNYNSNTTRTIVWQVDDGAIGHPSGTNTATTTLTVVGVDDAPTLSNVAATASFTEEGGAVTLANAVSISDPDNLNLVGAAVAIEDGRGVVGDVLKAAGTAAIAVSYDSASETLILTGTDTLAHYQAVLDSVTFNAGENPTNYGSNATRTIGWKLYDGSTISTEVTTAVNVISVNDAPVLSNVAASAQYTEDGPFTSLSGALTVTDPDDLNLSSATVMITGGTFAGDGDVLAANVAGTNITASYNAATETLTLTGADSLANYQSVLDSVTFQAGDNPDDFGSNPTRTITWQVQDPSGTANGGSDTSTPSTTTLTITAANDPPTLSVATTVSYTESGSAVTLSTSAVASDPDSLTLAGATVQLSGGFAGGGDVLSVSVAGTSITASYDAASATLTLTGADTLADYQNVLDSVAFTTAGVNPDNFGSNPTRTVTWVLDDGASSNNLSTAQIETINIAAVNDPPTLANVAASAQFTEGAGAVTLSSAAAVSDPDNLSLVSATIAIAGGAFAGDGDVLTANVAGTNITASYDSATETLTLTGSDTPADYQAVLDSITFNSTSDNPTDFGSNPTRTVTWVANDGSGSFNLSSVATTTVAVTDINDSPTLSNVAASTSFTEGGGAVTLSPAASTSDPDNLTLANATVRITGGTFAGDGDVLAANVAGTNIAASYDSATETLTLSGSDTLANYQQVLDSLTFSSTSDNPDDYGSNPTRTVTWVLDDGSGSFNLSATQTGTVSITAINDAPTLTSVVGATSYTENAASLKVSPSLTISDPDNLGLVNATVSISNGYAGDGDVLAVSTAGTSITASYNATTETLTLTSSDTLAHYQQVLESLTFVTPSDNPTDYGSFPSRVLTWTVNDGSASNNTSAPRYTTIAITAVDDPPILANVAATVGFLPHHTITISPSIAVSDPDNLTLMSATVAIAAGSFAGDGDVLAANVTGTSITASYNAATETLTLSGADTLAHYQSVLDSVTFASGGNPSHGNSNRTRTVTWVVNDGGGSNNLSTAATTTISIGGSSARNDFNGDGKSDLLLQAVNNVMVDLLNGTSIASSATTSAPIGQAVEAAADFNGDGKADIVLQSTSGVPNGTPYIWLMDGTGVASTVTLANPGTSWHVIAADDFNGDGNPDLLFQNTNGAAQIWEMNGTSVVKTAVVGNPGPSWRAIGAGDFNGDGNADILFQKDDGTPMIWEMNGTSVVASATLPNPGKPWQAIGTGDFNGDGDADILFQNTNGTPLIWEMNSTSIVASATLSNPGKNWQAIGTEDFNGDGDADILFQNTNGTPLIWEMNGTTVASTFALPNPGPVWKLEDDGPIAASQMESGANSGGGTMHASAPDVVAGAGLGSGSTPGAPLALAGTEALLFPGGSGLPQLNNQHLTSLSG